MFHRPAHNSISDPRHRARSEQLPRAQLLPPFPALTPGEVLLRESALDRLQRCELDRDAEADAQEGGGGALLWGLAVRGQSAGSGGKWGKRTL